VPDFTIRWSAIEARKPYASPFGVTFLDDDGEGIGGLAVNGQDLLYYSQFQQAVLRLAGELFGVDQVDTAADPQRAWLDRLSTKVPALDGLEVQPASYLDETAHERRFRFSVLAGAARDEVVVSAATLADYQELQAALAHLTGRLFRDPAIEAVEDPEQRRLAWMAALRRVVRRPGPDDRIAEAWPW
jgi:hypothetical protein